MVNQSTQAIHGGVGRNVSAFGVRRIGVSAYRRIGVSGSWLLAGAHPSSKPPWRPVDKSRIRKKKNFNLPDYGRYSKHGRSSAGSLVRSFFFN
jgi:hypothetical protein